MAHLVDEFLQTCDLFDELGLLVRDCNLERSMLLGRVSVHVFVGAVMCTPGMGVIVHIRAEGTTRLGSLYVMKTTVTYRRHIVII